MYDDYYGYGYGYSIIAGLAIYFVIFAVLGVIQIVASWKVYKKAGRPGWASIIPFYNLYILFDIVYGSGVKFLLLLIPIYNIILYIKTMLKLAKVFGKTSGFGVGLIFLYPIFLMILGFGKAEYIGFENNGETVKYTHTDSSIETPVSNTTDTANEPLSDNTAVKETANTATEEAMSTEKSLQEKVDEKTVAEERQPAQTEAPQNKVMFCSKCGTKITGGKFCKNCGAPVNK